METKKTKLPKYVDTETKMTVNNKIYQAWKPKHQTEKMCIPKNKVRKISSIYKETAKFPHGTAYLKKDWHIPIGPEKMQWKKSLWW